VSSIKSETEYFWAGDSINAIRVYFSLNQIDLYSRIIQKKCFNIFKEVKNSIISSPDIFYPMNNFYFEFHQDITNYSIYNYKKISSLNDEVCDSIEAIQSFFLILALLLENEFTVTYCKGIVTSFWEIRKDSIYASSRSLEYLAREIGLITTKGNQT